MDGAGSYSVARRAGLLPTELTGMWGWILLRSPHQGRGSTPVPAPTKQRPVLVTSEAVQPQPETLTVIGIPPVVVLHPLRYYRMLLEPGPMGPAGSGHGYCPVGEKSSRGGASR